MLVMRQGTVVPWTWQVAGDRAKSRNGIYSDRRAGRTCRWMEVECERKTRGNDESKVVARTPW